jgi:hypothetical protein
MANATTTTRFLYPKVTSGDRFSRLVAVRKIDSEYWVFRCDCGTEKRFLRRNVIKGVSKSCGCLHREVMSRIKATHGHSRGGKVSLTFRSYRNMMSRCYSKTNNRYAEYGARGIEVCDRWRGNFENFLFDMGDRPSLAHSIERKDNDGPYAPWNCIWGTVELQAQNRSSNLTIEIDGVRMILAEAARRFGVPYTTLKARIFKHGWEHRRALTEPVRKLTRRSA